MEINVRSVMIHLTVFYLLQISPSCGIHFVLIFSRPSIPNEFDFDDDANESKTVLIPRKTPGKSIYYTTYTCLTLFMLTLHNGHVQFGT